MSLTLRAAIGLSAGLMTGIAISSSNNTSLLAMIPLVEPIGAVWVNALQMTVIPLVVSLLITGVGSSADAAAIGRVGLKAVVVFLILLFAVAAVTALVAPPLLSWLTVDGAAATSLQTNMGSAVTERAKDIPTVGQWLVSLIPINPIRAATEGAMLPLIIFTLLFGFALTQIAPDLRQIILSFFRGTGEAMLVVVRWVLLFAPVGIFALVLPLAAKMGLGAVGALAYYVVLASALPVAVMLSLYPLAIFLGSVSFGPFFRATMPAQAVAFSSQSSLASLPAMIEGAESRLRLPPRITRFVLPLAIAIFRLSGPIRMTVGALFIAHIYVIPLSAMQIATAAFTSVLMSIGGVSLPGGAGFFASFVPVFLVVGLPIEGVGILLAVDTIPDVFQTVNNVTADMAATTIVARFSKTPLPVVESAGYEKGQNSVGEAMPSQR
jgi:proton glutamate symport protein